MTGFYADSDLTPNRITEARARMAGRYIDLTSSNPTHHGLSFPPQILEDAARGYWGTRRYAPDPRGLPEAREAIRRYYAGRTPAIDIAPEQIFITASTSEAYGLLFALLAEPGDNVLGPEVTYPLFEYLAQLRQVQLRSYALDPEHGWAIDGASLRAAADWRTQAVLVISPHNPTGAIERERLHALAALRLPIICDEVFAPFTYAIPHTPPLSALYDDVPVFLLNGISKLFALPDLKLGWIVLNGWAYERYGARLELLNDTFLSCSSLIQHMLPQLFEHGMPFVERMVAQVRGNLDMAIELLRSCERLRISAPDGGYYLFPQVLGVEDEEQLVLDLLEAGVLVHPGYFYGYERGAHLMISCLTEREQLQAGLRILVERLA